MIYEIGNKHLRVKINTLGAEMQSVLALPSNLEVLWQADERYWARHAPILFPIIGKLKGNKLKIDDDEYSMTQHGFARDCEFSLLSHSNSSITLQLKSDEKTLAQFPFAFELTVNYCVLGNKLECSFTVKNGTEAILPFSLGGHPAFQWPLLPNAPKKSHKIHFNKNEEDGISQLKDGLIFRDDLPSPLNNNVLNLTDTLFENDALIFKDVKSNKLRYEAMSDTESNAYIEMIFDDFNDLGIWTKPGANFICLEPWLGYSSDDGFDGDFNQKKGLIHLPANTERSFTFSIKVEIS